ncbi:MAG TPA: hypothetical protein VGK32_20435 [Vicinamibacterales bacterium]|jgi:KDO2-lipid IV(A) lauroyltransferase
MQRAREQERVQWQLHGLNTRTVYGLTCWGVARMPRHLSMAIGHVATWLAYRLLHDTTAALVENLRVVRPDYDERELRALALRTYRSYARDEIDFLRGLRLSKGQLSRWMIDDSGFDRVLAEGRGVLLLAGHLGNWELGGVMLRVFYDYPLTVIGLPETDPAVNDMRRALRASIGVESLEVRQAADTALRIRRLLSENRIVAMLPDRALGRDRVDVDFFDRKVGFLRTPALMAYMTGAPLLPAFVLRQADGRYTAFSSDPIYVPRTGDRDVNVRVAMQAFASALEVQVRKYPHLWYQFYPYWRDSTEDAALPSARSVSGA